MPDKEHDRPTPADTNARRLRDAANAFEADGLRNIVTAAFLRSQADKEWPQ